MNLLRVRAHQFKTSNSAIVFKAKHPEGFYKDKINFDDLYKYLSATDKLQANNEDFEWLLGLIDIVLKTNKDKK